MAISRQFRRLSSVLASKIRLCLKIEKRYPPQSTARTPLQSSFSTTFPETAIDARGKELHEKLVLDYAGNAH